MAKSPDICRPTRLSPRPARLDTRCRFAVPTGRCRGTGQNAMPGPAKACAVPPPGLPDGPPLMRPLDRGLRFGPGARHSVNLRVPVRGPGCRGHPVTRAPGGGRAPPGLCAARSSNRGCAPRWQGSDRETRRTAVAATINKVVKTPDEIEAYVSASSSSPGSGAVPVRGVCLMLRSSSAAAARMAPA